MRHVEVVIMGKERLKNRKPCRFYIFYRNPISWSRILESQTALLLNGAMGHGPTLQNLGKPSLKGLKGNNIQSGGVY